MLDNIRFVLVHTSHPGNIGSAARAMKTMGLNQLYLVAPEHFPHPKAKELAASAYDILEKAHIVPTVEQAILDCTLVVGTSARTRSIPWPMTTPRSLAQQIKNEAPAQTAILFGQEQSGLPNEVLQHCHLHVQIPTDLSYSSLNLAAAVQILAYELQLVRIESCVPIKAWDYPLATAQEMEKFFVHLETVLIAIDFLKIRAPRRLMTRMRRLFARTRLDAMELNMLRGVLTAIQENIQLKS